MPITHEMSCPSPQILNDLMANRLPAGQVDLIREHIANCPKCDGSGQLNPQQESVYPFLEPAQERGEIARLGDYRILGLLGEGGMAIVFEAEDSKLHRKVALKVLRPEKCTLEMRERFLREARLLASLPHNHIVAVFSVDEANGVPFMAMERLEGMTLEQRLRQDQTLPLDESLSIARQIAEGLQAVHEKELVHRDVKPANIWLETTREGRFRRVKLLDFGIARRMTEGAIGVTLSGQIVGTPSYMAPEQALGLPVDRRSDLYSLGCVLFRMLVGRPPFEGEPGETMLLLESVIKGEAPRVGIAAPHLPPQVARLIQQLLSREPVDRPTSARELVAKLRHLEDNALNVLGPYQAATVAAPSVRRAGTLGIILGSTAIVISLLLGATTAYYTFLHPLTAGDQRGNVIRIGVVHTLSGPLSFHERPMVNATKFAIEEINAAGGLLGRSIEVISRDGNGREEIFEQLATELLEDQKVDVLFGCWSAASRKRVEKQCEKYGKFLFFSAGYEGLEDSPGVVYLGGTPNQTLIPLVNWAYKNLNKRRFMLLGTEEIYSRGVNEILKHELESLGAPLVLERYLLVGDDDFSSVCDEIAAKKIDFIVNTVDGPANKFFLSELRRRGLRPPSVSTAWASLSEVELSQFQVERLVGDYSAATYFESLPGTRNVEFIKRFKARFPSDRVNDAMETAYFGVYLWKKAVEKARTTDTEAVRRALAEIEVEAPEGTIRLADSRHAYRVARVGRIGMEGVMPQFEIVHTSAKPVAPEPFPHWRTREQWRMFADELYQAWGQRWEKVRSNESSRD